MDRKSIQKFIVEARDQGKADQEIYNELTPQYYDKKGVAMLITGTPTREDKQKYKFWNTVLLALIGLTILSKVILGFSIMLATHEAVALLFVFVMPIINVWFFIEVARYNAPSYQAIGIFTFISLMQAFQQNQNHNIPGIYSPVNIVVTLLIGFLAFFLSGKLFPKFKSINMQKDEHGEYVV